MVLDRRYLFGSLLGSRLGSPSGSSLYLFKHWRLLSNNLSGALFGVEVYQMLGKGCPTDWYGAVKLGGKRLVRRVGDESHHDLAGKRVWSLNGLGKTGLIQLA